MTALSELTITWGRRDGRLVALTSAAPAPAEPVSARSLTDAERARLVQCAADGRTYGQLAREFGISRSAIAGIVFRARQRGVVIPQRPPLGAFPRSPAPPPPVPAPLVAPDQPYAPAGVDLRDLRDAHCRWPLWANGARPSLRFCGNAVARGSSYCPHCKARSEAPLVTADIDRKLGLRRRSA